MLLEENKGPLSQDLKLFLSYYPLPTCLIDYRGRRVNTANLRVEPV